MPVKVNFYTHISEVRLLELTETFDVNEKHIFVVSVSLIPPQVRIVPFGSVTALLL